MSALSDIIDFFSGVQEDVTRGARQFFGTYTPPQGSRPTRAGRQPRTRGPGVGTLPVGGGPRRGPVTFPSRSEGPVIEGTPGYTPSGTRGRGGLMSTPRASQRAPGGTFQWSPENRTWHFTAAPGAGQASGSTIFQFDPKGAGADFDPNATDWADLMDLQRGTTGAGKLSFASPGAPSDRFSFGPGDQVLSSMQELTSGIGQSMPFAVQVGPNQWKSPGARDVMEALSYIEGVDVDPYDPNALEQFTDKWLENRGLEDLAPEAAAKQLSSWVASSFGPVRQYLGEKYTGQGGRAQRFARQQAGGHPSDIFAELPGLAYGGFGGGLSIPNIYGLSDPFVQSMEAFLGGTPSMEQAPPEPRYPSFADALAEVYGR